PLTIQYKDFCRWRNSEKQQEEMLLQEKYWLEGFAGEVSALHLPTDYPRPAVLSFEGHTLKFKVGENDTAALKQMAIREEVTLYMVLLAIYYVFLSKISNREEVVVGTPLAGRRYPELEGIIGMFVNTLALRNEIPGAKTFIQFLQEVKEKTLEAFENQDYPFESLVEKVVGQRDTSSNPLFDVMFALQNIGNAALEINGITLTSLESDTLFRTSKFDLTLLAMEEDGGLELQFEYCTKLFKETTIQRYINYFKKIISDILENETRDIKLSEIEIISDKEKKRLLFEYNDTGTLYPRTKAIHELFEQKAGEIPENEAVVVRTQNHDNELDKPDSVRSTLTYRELEKKSRHLAFVLREKGVKPESKTETYAELRLEIDNERWKGVPIYIRTGKALKRKGTEIGVVFKKQKETPFPCQTLNQNRVIIKVQPSEGIVLDLVNKVPGWDVTLTNTN
ncbi:MAG: hypothetical protein GY757_49825, partial [bacterium]|nr:hypothetical protein [bacterium]